MSFFLLVVILFDAATVRKIEMCKTGRGKTPQGEGLVDNVGDGTWTGGSDAASITMLQALSMDSVGEETLPKKYGQFAWLSGKRFDSILKAHVYARERVQEQYNLRNMQKLVRADQDKNELFTKPDCNEISPSLVTTRYSINDKAIARSVAIYGDLSIQWDSQKRQAAYDPANGKCANDVLCLPYKQMVWPKTTEIDCGALNCDTGKWGEFDRIYLVCFYEPAFQGSLTKF